eukprot:403362753
MIPISQDEAQYNYSIGLNNNNQSTDHQKNNKDPAINTNFQKQSTALTNFQGGPLIKKKTIIQQNSLDDYQTMNTINQTEIDPNTEFSANKKFVLPKEKLSLFTHKATNDFESSGQISSSKKPSGYKQSSESQESNYFFPDVNSKNKERYQLAQYHEMMKSNNQQDSIRSNRNPSVNENKQNAKQYLYPQNNGTNSPMIISLAQNDDSFTINKSGFYSNGANLTTNASLASNNNYDFIKSPYVLNKNKNSMRKELFQDQRKILSNLHVVENTNALSINQSSNLSNDSNASPSLQATRTALLKLKESGNALNNANDNGLLNINLFQVNSSGNSQINTNNFNNSLKRDNNLQQQLNYQNLNPQMLPSSLKILEKYKFKMPQGKQIQQFLDSSGQMSGSPNIRKRSNNNLVQISSIASFLDETLSKLKSRKPNKRNLKPLDNQVLLRFQQQLASQMKNFQNKNRDVSPDETIASDINQTGGLNSSKVLDLNNEINFEDLNQEDRFYLIQQLENIQQNIRYQLDGSPYIFQDFEDGDDQYADGYLDETEISPINTGKDQENFSKIFREQKRQLEIIQDEEDEEDKDSVVQLGDANDQRVMFSNETFDLRSPTQKKNKILDQQEKMMANIQSQSQLRQILNDRKIKKSISLVDINEDDEDGILMADCIQQQEMNQINIIKHSKSPDLKKHDLLNLKNAIIEPDDIRSRNNQIPLFTESQQSRVVIMSHQNQDKFNQSDLHSNLNLNKLGKGIKNKKNTLGLSPIGNRNPFTGGMILEEQDSQVLFQSKNLITYDKSPTQSMLFRKNQSNQQQQIENRNL